MRADRDAQRLGQAAGESAFGQVALGVELRERALLLRQRHRGRVGRVAHALGDPRRQGAALGAVVAHAQHGQRIAHAGEAHADAALGHGLLALLRQRPEGQVQHVVQRAHLQRHHLFEGLEVEAGQATEAEGVAHETRQDHRPEVSAAVGRQWLLATVVHHESVGVEGMHVVHRHVVHGLFAIGLQAIDSGHETLTVGRAPIVAEYLIQTSRLVGVPEADALGEHLQVVATDHQFVLGLRRVVGLAAATVGQVAQAGGPPFPIHRRDNAQAQQHALRRLEQCVVALRKTHTHPFFLRTLHAAVSIEQSSQQTFGKVGRTLFHRGRDALRPGRHAQ